MPPDSLPAGRAVKARQVGHLEQPTEALRADRLRYAVQIRVQIEVLLNAEVLVEAKALRHVTDAILDRLRPCHDVDVEHPQASGIGRHQSRHHPNQRRLARTVWADECGQRTGPHRQRDVVDGRHRAAAGRGKRLPQRLGHDRQGRAGHAPARAISTVTG